MIILTFFCLYIDSAELDNLAALLRYLVDRINGLWITPKVKQCKYGMN